MSDTRRMQNGKLLLGLDHETAEKLAKLTEWKGGDPPATKSSIIRELIRKEYDEKTKPEMAR